MWICWPLPSESVYVDMGKHREPMMENFKFQISMKERTEVCLKWFFFFFFFFFCLPITIGEEVKRGPMAYMPSWNWGINLKLLLSIIYYHLTWDYYSSLRFDTPWVHAPSSGGIEYVYFHFLPLEILELLTQFILRSHRVFRTFRYLAHSGPGFRHVLNEHALSLLPFLISARFRHDCNISDPIAIRLSVTCIETESRNLYHYSLTNFLSKWPKDGMKLLYFASVPRRLARCGRSRCVLVFESYKKTFCLDLRSCLFDCYRIVRAFLVP